MLVHICCSVDSHYFLQRLKNEHCNEVLRGFFYNPNIHPKSEHDLRFNDVKSSCDELGIELFGADYEINEWLSGVKGLESEVEGAKRCDICFDMRLQKTYEMAQILGETTITTTLFMSPKKSHTKLQEALDKICFGTSIKFIAPQYRKNGGSNEQMSVAKKANLYHQNYCGCFYALKMQRDKKLCTELFSPINGQILPSSIEEKIEFYAKVAENKKSKKEFSIKREKFLNYRLLSLALEFENTTISGYSLFYSHFTSAKIRFLVDSDVGIFESQKDGVVLIGFDKFNQILGGKFVNYEEFLATPLSVEDEILFRQNLLGSYSLSPIIIIKNLQKGRYEIRAKSEIYEDFREKIVTNKD